MLLLPSCAAILLAALAAERVRLDRSRRAVALRIAVTGTRGKTTVARLLASVLREDGRTVLAKTTGSEPCLVLPDGSVERVRRRGPASILEQKALLHRAARLRTDVVVAEVMSIHAENQQVEGRRILVPQLVLATNFHPDHTEAQGSTPEEVGAVLALAVPAGATVLAPEGRCPASFRDAVAAVGATLVEVGGDERAPSLAGPFAENLSLVVAAAGRLGVGEDALRRGIAAAEHDVGELRGWTVPTADGRAHLVNAFAANDPESTARVYDEVMSSPSRPRCVALLSLRADRGDRTLQWADALAHRFCDRFDVVLVVGLHARALARRVRTTPVTILGAASPEALTRAALEALGPAGGVVFGIGNIVGPGARLVEHWAHIGSPALARPGAPDLPCPPHGERHDPA
jgi:poly-gamma-glutamate synthase PgsB/CapB